MRYTVIANLNEPCICGPQIASSSFRDREDAEDWMSIKLLHSGLPIKNFVMVDSDGRVYLFNASGDLLASI